MELMRIKGEFRDILKRNGEIIEDKGWKSNEIVPDFGEFLAAIMKKDFKDEHGNTIAVGIEYIAVGCGSGGRENFKNKVGEFFKELKSGHLAEDEPYVYDDNPDKWIWAKKINYNEIGYENDTRNKLRIDVTFGNDNPKNPENHALKFEEFALLGYHDPSGGPNSEIKLFFINYATHGTIEKEKNTTITRTIKLTFPVN
jgi:hypothetical protein